LKGSLIYIAQKQYAEAMKYSQKGLSLAQQVGDLSLIGWANKLIGMIYIDREQYARSREYLWKALSAFEQSGEREKMA
jgi:tetratricopeptide (TPR) repeat protein